MVYDNFVKNGVLPSVKAIPGADPASYSMVTRGSFTRVNGLVREADN
jgi:hypothetical protein